MECRICGLPTQGANKTCGKTCADKLRATHTGRRPANYLGRTKTTDGYIYVRRPEHPAASRKGYVAEHRLVVEERLGRYLHQSERVHHRNGVRSDNRPENLEIWLLGTKDPHGARVRDLWRELDAQPEMANLGSDAREQVRAAFSRVFGFGGERAA